MADIKPRKPAPELRVATLTGEDWRLRDQRPDTFTMIVFYRGLHCPICKVYLRELDGKLPEFRALGVEAIAISTDVRERAQKTVETWGLKNLRVGYGLSIEAARDWGLYISTSIKPEEPGQFAEPGLFLIKPDGALYAANIQTMPFARPNFPDVLKAVDFIKANNYPPRGEA